VTIQSCYQGGTANCDTTLFAGMVSHEQRAGVMKMEKIQACVNPTPEKWARPHGFLLNLI
jgi:hypothetical protein